MIKKHWKAIIFCGIILILLIHGVMWCYKIYSRHIADRPWDYPYTKWECEEIGLCYMNQDGLNSGRALIRIDGEYYKASVSTIHNGLINIYLGNGSAEEYILYGWALCSPKRCKVEVKDDYIGLLKGKETFTLKRSDITKEEYETFKEKVESYPIVTLSELEKKLGIAE